MRPLRPSGSSRGKIRGASTLPSPRTLPSTAPSQSRNRMNSALISYGVGFFVAEDARGRKSVRRPHRRHAASRNSVTKGGMRPLKSSGPRRMRMSTSSGRCSLAMWRMMRARSASAFSRRGQPLEQRDVTAVAHQRPAWLGRKLARPRVRSLPEARGADCRRDQTRRRHRYRPAPAFRRGNKAVPPPPYRTPSRRPDRRRRRRAAPPRRRNCRHYDRETANPAMRRDWHSRFRSRRRAACGRGPHSGAAAVCGRSRPRPLALKIGEMAVDLAAPLGGKRPLPGFERNFRVVERGDFNVRRARRCHGVWRSSLKRLLVPRIDEQSDQAGHALHVRAAAGRTWR